MTQKTITVSVRPAPEWIYGIAYDYKGFHDYLTGSKATLYRGMIWMDGEEKAASEFWDIFYARKSGAVPPENAAQPL